VAKWRKCGGEITVEDGVADPSQDGVEEEILVHGRSDGVCFGDEMGAFFAELGFDA
jgi:hypothetical protein